MFKFEFGACVKGSGISGRIMARAEYEDGRVVYCVREIAMHEGHVPRQQWISQNELAADIPDELPPDPA